MRFEDQQYQRDCVDNIMQCLEGVQLRGGAGDFSTLQGNLAELNKDARYQFPTDASKRQIDILMETGTGKTFTYLKTIFELNKEKGVRKFIIVLPRVAIKLGTIQNIQLTKGYFFNEYRKHLNIIDYPKDGLRTVQQNFINTDDLCVLITTNSAFSSDANNINKASETLFKFGSTWNGIASKNPVVIIDEPHLLKGAETQKGLAKLNNSLVIRFGATYPTEEKNRAYQLCNVAYCLDSISAFNQYLVKRIGVSTIIHQQETSALSVRNIKPRQSFDACYNINEQLHKRTLKLGDDIGATTGLAEYRGIRATRINAGKIHLSNHTYLEASAGSYALTDDEIKHMITHAIRRHFVKEAMLFNKGIKALSLFFIPKVDDFRGDNPRIKTIFEECYKNIRQSVLCNTTNKEYKAFLKNDFAADGTLQVHEGYFSGDKGSAEKKESDGINLILTDKEKLLSLATPLRFIFSVWALQEGWDNPNIFTICKLSSTSGDTSRRQQVGRGLRLAVNQQGSRMTHAHLAGNEQAFYEINELDMVVSGQEQDFIHAIQHEIQEASFSLVGDTLTLELLKEKGLTDREAARFLVVLEDNGIIAFSDNDGGYRIQSSVAEFLPHNREKFAFIDDEKFELVKSLFQPNRSAVRDNNQKPKMVRIKPALGERFKTLWQAINKKSKIVYKGIQQDAIIAAVSEKFNAEDIPRVQITIRKERYNTHDDCIEAVEEDAVGSSEYFKKQSLTAFVAEFAKAEKLPLAFTIRLFNQLNMQHFFNNPKAAQEALVYHLKETIHDMILAKISYEFSETDIYSNVLQGEQGELLREVSHQYLGKFHEDTPPAPANFLYNAVVWDSLIEKQNIRGDSPNVGDKKVTVFAKLPQISIPTPYKAYNPDFAYFIEQEGSKQLFLIVETKGYDHEDEIPAAERTKIEYGKKFFAALQAQMPEVSIHFKPRLNRQTLTQLLQDLSQ